jgi:hypothetical protein
VGRPDRGSITARPTSTNDTILHNGQSTQFADESIGTSKKMHAWLATDGEVRFATSRDGSNCCYGVEGIFFLTPVRDVVFPTGVKKEIVYGNWDYNNGGALRGALTIDSGGGWFLGRDATAAAEMRPLWPRGPSGDWLGNTYIANIGNQLDSNRSRWTTIWTPYNATGRYIEVGRVKDLDFGQWGNACGLMSPDVGAVDSVFIGYLWNPSNGIALAL